ncbi:MAG: hypothetical protein ACMXYA_00755 [Candidatus Woesearchaeota archaeon]
MNEKFLFGTIGILICSNLLLVGIIFFSSSQLEESEDYHIQLLESQLIDDEYSIFIASYNLNHEDCLILDENLQNRCSENVENGLFSEALLQNSTNYCESIRSDTLRESCLFEVLRQIDSSEISCTSFQGELQLDCANHLLIQGHNEDICSTLEQTFQDECYITASIIHEKSFCDLIQNDVETKLCEVFFTHDLTSCENIPRSLQNNCYMLYSLGSEDTNACQKITDDFMRNSCLKGEL